MPRSRSSLADLTTQIKSILLPLVWVLFPHKKQQTIEDLTKSLFLIAKKERATSPTQSLAEAHHLTDALVEQLLRDMEKGGLYSSLSQNLTTRGKTLALQLIRKHRLIETYLSLHSGYSAQEWHKRAHKLEHTLSDQNAKTLARQLHHPRIDPNGDPIPSPRGEIPQHEDTQRMSDVSHFPMLVRVVRFSSHGSTSAEIYYQHGLLPHTQMLLLEKKPTGEVIVLIHGAQQTIDKSIADSLFVRPDNSRKPQEVATIRTIALCDLKKGESALIDSISPGARGTARRRLMDLGFVPGSQVSVDLVSPLGNPMAFRIRETTIALRKDQASLIRVVLDPKP